MATRKITITLPADLLDSVKHAVEEGKADSVSAYITAALRWQTERDPLDLLIAGMSAEYGEPGPEDLAAVDRFLAEVRKYAADSAA